MADSKDKLDIGDEDQRAPDQTADDARSLFHHDDADESLGAIDSIEGEGESQEKGQDAESSLEFKGEAEGDPTAGVDADQNDLDARLLEAAQRWAEEFNPELATGDGFPADDLVLEEGSAELKRSQDKADKKQSKPKKPSRAAHAPVSAQSMESTKAALNPAEFDPSEAQVPEDLGFASGAVVLDEGAKVGGEEKRQADRAELAEPPAAASSPELPDPGFDSELNPSSVVDELLAYGDRLADREQARESIAPPDADGFESKAEETPAKTKGRSKAKEKAKDPKANPGSAQRARAGASLANDDFEAENQFEMPLESPSFFVKESAIEPEIVTDDRQGLMRWDEAINLEAQVEAILFAAPKPISVSEVAQALADDDGQEPDHSTLEAIVQQLLRLYKERNGGFRLEYDKGAGYQFRTVPAAAPIMERMFSSRQRPLSRAAHETLAIIAYRQPCTRADIEFIRGVDAGSIIKNLLERDLVACVGRKEDSGRPMLFGTTAEFMRVFRIQTLNDLPPLSAFQPASEAIIDAFQKIERPDLDIDVEDFIGDESRQQPEISGDLASDFAKSGSVFEVRGDGSDATAATDGKVRRVGGIFDNEGFPSDGHENTKVVIPVGDSFAAGSGEDASRGPNQHQRQGGAGTGDEDPT